MAQPAATRFPTPAIDDLPDDIRTRLLAVQEKSGFVPNVFLALAHRPDEFRAFFAYHDALMDKEGGLTKAEREMIVVATASANQCQYCVVAHGAILRIRAKNPLIADQVAVNYRKADITPRQKRHARLRDEGVPRGATRFRKPILPRSQATASATTTSGTSPRSRPSSRCRTGWPTSPACAPMTNSI